MVAGKKEGYFIPDCSAIDHGRQHEFKFCWSRPSDTSFCSVTCATVAQSHHGVYFQCAAGYIPNLDQLEDCQSVSVAEY